MKFKQRIPERWWCLIDVVKGPTPVYECRKFRKWGCDVSPTFKYWDMFLVAVQIMLSNVRAERESDWSAHLMSSGKLAFFKSWFYLGWKFEHIKYIYRHPSRVIRTVSNEEIGQHFLCETSILLTKVEELFEDHVQPLIGKFRKWGCDASSTFKYWEDFWFVIPTIPPESFESFMMVFSVPISLQIPLKLPNVCLMDNSPFY
jgi:hypothetical protein